MADAAQSLGPNFSITLVRAGARSHALWEVSCWTARRGLVTFEASGARIAVERAQRALKETP